MVDVRFGIESMSSVRFGVSPLFETTLSVGALDDPQAALHLPWVEHVAADVAGLDLEPVRLLMRRDVYAPDFLNPPPGGPTVELEDELAEMIATPASQIRAEVQRAYSDRAMPAALERFIAHPRAAVRALAELLRRYWELALADHWPRVSTLLENDILYRAKQIAEAGTSGLFDDLDPSISWDGAVLRVERNCAHGPLELDERGLLLLPSAFSWPKVLLVSAPPWQPTIIYPARGVGMLWEPERPVPADALEKLLGSNRAAILTALDRPRSTTELARVLEISPGGVSQHLSILHSAGLISRRRAQRMVLYLRSEHGDALVQTVAG